MIIRPYNPTARRREEKNGRDRIGRARYSTLFILHSSFYIVQSSRQRMEKPLPLL